MISKNLQQAARACGIALSYKGSDKGEIYAGNETISHLLNGLTTIENVRSGLPQVIVCWDGVLKTFWMWSEGIPQNLDCELIAENGLSRKIQTNIKEVVKRKEGFRVRLDCDEKIDFGYYDLKTTDGAETYFSFLISAPQKLKEPNKTWGVFAPTYALKSEHTQGLGGFKDLQEAARFIKGEGGSFIGTLPLLPVFHDRDDSNHSPYSPISRLFWDEIFLDVTNLPGYVGRAEFKTGPHADYKKTYAIKKTIIEKAVKEFFNQSPEGNEDFKSYLAETPYLKEYAEFHSQGDEVKKQYHLYAQYACHLQMQEFKNNETAELYLDYPVGVHPEGFDAKAFPHLFLDGFTVGAPPDKLSAKGQNWGFKPLHPKALITDKFRYFRATLRHYFRYAKMLRMDHVMGLYRLYCIPENQEASKGAYIYYPFEALLAVLCLETWKHDGILIGENLGTVPEAVDEAMKNHNILRMWISQFEITKDPANSFDTIEPAMMAGMNTHDMFPFEAFMTNKDLVELGQRDIIGKEDAILIIEERKTLLEQWKKETSPFLTIVKGLAASPAYCVIIGMEDLWHETMPQNIPGTIDDYPNWSKTFSLPLEDWAEHKNIDETFKILNKYRGKLELS